MLTRALPSSGGGGTSLKCDYARLTSKAWTQKTCTGRIRYIVYSGRSIDDYGVVDVNDLSTWMIASRPSYLSVSEFFKDLSADGKTIYYNQSWESQTIDYYFFYDD